MASKKKTRPSLKKTRKQRRGNNAPTQALPSPVFDETVSPEEAAALAAEYYDMTTPEELHPDLQRRKSFLTKPNYAAFSP